MKPGVEEKGRVLIEQAIEQPLDPQRLATGVRNEEEALEIYFLSCAAIDIDHFMERSYLNALGDALKIPRTFVKALNAISNSKNVLWRSNSALWIA